MIKNEIEFSVTVRKLAEFKAVLIDLEKADISPSLKYIQQNAVKAEIEGLEGQVMEYNAKNSLL